MTTCLNQSLINNEIITKSMKLKSSSKNIKGIHTSNLSISTDYISYLYHFQVHSVSLCLIKQSCKHSNQKTPKSWTSNSGTGYISTWFSNIIIAASNISYVGYSAASHVRDKT